MNSIPPLIPINKEEGKIHIPREERERIIDIETRMVAMELEQAEVMLKSTALDKDLEDRWNRRILALKTMQRELSCAKTRLEGDEQNVEKLLTTSVTLLAGIPESGVKALATLEELGLEVAAARHGVDLVALYQEFGQDIEKFHDTINGMKISDLERMNGVPVEVVAEEMRGPFPDMPLYWRKTQAIIYLKYLAVLRSTGSHSLAQRASGILNRIVRYTESASELIMKLKDDALDENSNYLEDEARRRAVEGVEEPVFYQGDVVGHVKKYSDDLLKLLLKANRREKYVMERKQGLAVNIQNNTFNLEGVNISDIKEQLKNRIEGRIVDVEVQGATKADSNG